MRVVAIFTTVGGFNVIPGFASGIFTIMTTITVVSHLAVVKEVHRRPGDGAMTAIALGVSLYVPPW